MKEPLQILMNEHRQIERACQVLIAMAKKVNEKELCKTQDWRDLIGFIKGFADECHHGKEEDILFKVLKERGMPSEHGPIAVMLSEHDVGRDIVQSMEKSLSAIDKNDKTAMKTLHDSAYDYVTFLSQHIRKEDTILYPMANHLLRDEDVKRLLDEYRCHEDKEMGKGTHEKFLKILESLVERYGEGQIPQAKGCGSGCGCSSES